MDAPSSSCFHAKARQLIQQQLSLTEELQREQLRLLRAPWWHVLAWVAAWLTLSMVIGRIFFG